MRTGEDNRDLTALEKKAGQKAARAISRKLKTNVRNAHYPLGLDKVANTGAMLSAVSAGIKIKFDSLEGIRITASRATFIQHFGFEGIKANGKKMRLQAQGHLDFLSGDSPILEQLADEIGQLRAEEITSKIRW